MTILKRFCLNQFITINVRHQNFAIFIGFKNHNYFWPFSIVGEVVGKCIKNGSYNFK